MCCLRRAHGSNVISLRTGTWHFLEALRNMKVYCWQLGGPSESWRQESKYCNYEYSFLPGCRRQQSRWGWWMTSSGDGWGFLSNEFRDWLLCTLNVSNHDGAIKCKPFPRYWPFVRGIHRSPVTFVWLRSLRDTVTNFYVMQKTLAIPEICIPTATIVIWVLICQKKLSKTSDYELHDIEYPGAWIIIHALCNRSDYLGQNK